MGQPNHNLHSYEIWDGGMTAEEATQDTDPVTNIAVDTGYVFVVREYNDGAKSASGVNYQLYANNTTKSTGWFQVTASSTHVQTASVSGLTNGNSIATGNFKLASGPGTAIAGEECEDGVVASFTTANGEHTEFWFGFTIVSGDVDNNDNIDLAYYIDGVAPDTFTVNPSITVSEASPVNISIPQGALTLTGFAPTVDVTNDIQISIPQGALSLTGFAPTVEISADINIDVPQAALSLTGYAATINLTNHILIGIPQAALTLTGNAPTLDVTQDIQIGVPQAALTLTGFAPTLDPVMR